MAAKAITTLAAFYNLLGNGPFALGHSYCRLSQGNSTNTEQMPHGVVELVDRTSLFLCGCSLYHDEQLHLVGFAALEIKKLNDAMDMDLLVRKKPFREDDQGGVVDDVDLEDETSKGRTPITSDYRWCG